MRMSNADSSPAPILVVYERPDCGLCAEFWRELQGSGLVDGWPVKRIDIDTDQALVARFGERIPVLALGDIEVCQYFFDARLLAETLAKSGFDTGSGPV